jgi:ubiquinone biosynthesis protein COQ4
MLDREFATQHLLRTFDDPQAYGVHELFNQWWRYAPGDVIAKYEQTFTADPDARRWVEEGYYSEPLDLEALGQYAPGTLGRAYRDFIVENGLEAKIAMNYRVFHKMLEAQGILKTMPKAIEYAVLRGFQTHDFQHVATGYRATPRGEIALQAFNLAQLRFPYAAMWISTVTTRMTYIDPNSIEPLMDDISEGWSYGRRAGNITYARWEEMLDRPLDDVRREYGLKREGDEVKLAA